MRHLNTMSVLLFLILALSIAGCTENEADEDLGSGINEGTQDLNQQIAEKLDTPLPAHYVVTFKEGGGKYGGKRINGTYAVDSGEVRDMRVTSFIWGNPRLDCLQTNDGCRCIDSNGEKGNLSCSDAEKLYEGWEITIYDVQSKVPDLINLLKNDTLKWKNITVDGGCYIYDAYPSGLEGSVRATKIYTLCFSDSSFRSYHYKYSSMGVELETSYNLSVIG